jgi:hypothetical protein
VLGNFENAGLTIIAWMKEFTKQNIQMGDDMKRMPDHMHIIAPA